MTEKDLRKLGRMELVDILCRQREMIDELSADNEQLRRRVEDAERRCGEYEKAQQEQTAHRLETDELRGDLSRIMETVRSMAESGVPLQSGTACDHEAQAEDIISQARAQAADMLSRAQSEIARQREDFARQCEELAQGYKRLNVLFEDRGGDERA